MRRKQDNADNPMDTDNAEFTVDTEITERGSELHKPHGRTKGEDNPAKLEAEEGKEESGVIMSIGVTFKESSPHEATAIITDKTISLFEFVNVDGVLCQVSELTAESNIDLDKAKSISRGSHIPSKEDVIATLDVLGIINGGIKIPNQPIGCGKEVELATPEDIHKFLGMEQQLFPLGIGHLLRRPDVAITLDAAYLTHHVGIMGKIGSGKSNAAKLLVKEMSETIDGRIIVIDPHGEYGDYGYSHKVDTETTIKTVGFSIEKLVERYWLMDKYKVIEGNEKALNRVMELIKYETCPDQATLIGLISNYGGPELRRDMELVIRLEEMINVAKIALITITDKPLVFNFKTVEPMLSPFIVRELVETILKLCKTQGHFYTVIDEAHLFIPQARDKPSTMAITNLVLESRKFGSGVILVSQRPAMVNKDALSQCNTFIILNVTNDNDIQQLRRSTEWATKQMFQEVQRLKCGEALVSSTRLARPIFVKIPEVKKEG